MTLVRPFSTLGLRPFLWAEPADLELVQRRYRELSLVTHPDRVDPDDKPAIERAEADSARLNADFAIVRDFDRRCEAVAALASARSAPTPALAVDYFELQEMKAELGSTDAGYLTARERLLARVRTALESATSRLESLARPYPFAGFAAETPNWPWSDELPSELARALDERRYLQRLLDDAAR